MAREALAREAKELIDRIAATPRAAGSEDEARARATCAELLRRKGFTVTEEEFVYSAFPGRWAVPLLGLLSLFWFVAIGAALNSRRGEAVAAGVPFLVLLPALVYMVTRTIPESRLMGRRATNLVAIRGEAPTIWLMAHLDSKSQPVPMLVRIAAIIVVSSAMVLAIAGGFTAREYQVGKLFWILVCVSGGAGSLAMILSGVGNRSQGAIDNASGVAAALLTASELPSGTPAGVLLTSAEELRLQGARAWVRGHSTLPARAINFDGIDHVGTLTCMAKRGSPLAARLRTSAEDVGVRMRFRRVLPGIMVDALALGAAGWDAVTISKGNLSTLARIHTPGDSPQRLNGTGVAEVVEMVTNFIKREA